MYVSPCKVTNSCTNTEAMTGVATRDPSSGEDGMHEYWMSAINDLEGCHQREGKVGQEFSH